MFFIEVIIHLSAVDCKLFDRIFEKNFFECKLPKMEVLCKNAVVRFLSKTCGKLCGNCVKLASCNGEKRKNMSFLGEKADRFWKNRLK